MAKYEAMFILDPSLSDDDNKATLDDVKKIIKGVKGKVENENVWGERKLAYKINKSERGFYVLFDLEIDGTSIKDMNQKLNLNKNVWRYMFVKQES